MGQNISLIVTKSVDTKVPKEIPHLIKNGLLIIALKNNEFSYFVLNVLRSYLTNLQDYIEFDFVQLVNELKLSTFLGLHESEWGMPIDEVYFAVIDGEVIIESIESLKIDESDDQFILIPNKKTNPKELLGIDLSNMDYYHSYSDFKEKYIAEMETE
ncbi:hypothetical protein [Chryseobacterium vrystaatense]|uniref:Uncharacterized protein n=1 Tax=Chryseobacterium vrystaatense TaxID=307480 RepID=A0ABR4UH01_9FLAO|nr:hypothetical protein [Chryseobacterium vrystaatense]KFF23781.1 hypothetical protein IW16_23075 [Chryseobacterium vrystaatense]